MDEGSDGGRCGRRDGRRERWRERGGWREVDVVSDVVRWMEKVGCRERWIEI
ncbi:hypothetical protein A2U01_0106748, partial [Trifolium medium]|nr:hypothetical protein [Trifolium medium]